MKMIFYSHANKTRFYKKGFALKVAEHSFAGGQQ